MANKTSREVFEDKVEASLAQLDTDGPFIIKYKGQRMKMRSGKTSWNTIGAAKNAFHNSVNYNGLEKNLALSLGNDGWRGGHEEYFRLFEELLSDGTIEIVGVNNANKD